MEERRLSEVERWGYYITFVMYLLSPVFLGAIFDNILGYNGFVLFGISITLFASGLSVVYDEVRRKGI